MRQKGFTLIEILVVVSIISLMLAVTVPVSYEMYQRYQGSQKAEQVLGWLSAVRMESFLYNKECVVRASQGRLTVDGKEAGMDEVEAVTEQPIKFFKNGTTTGGKIRVFAHNSVFFVDVEAPFGNIQMKRSVEGE